MSFGLQPSNSRTTAEAARRAMIRPTQKPWVEERVLRNSEVLAVLESTLIQRLRSSIRLPAAANADEMRPRSKWLAESCPYINNSNFGLQLYMHLCSLHSNNHRTQVTPRSSTSGSR